MIRRLLNTGMTFVLVLSCWGSVFAAAPCPHGCHASAAAHSRAHAQQGDAEPGGHCHSEMNDGETHQENEASSHESHDAGEYADAGSTSSAEFSGGINSAHASCDHCMGRAELPSSSLTERGANQLKEGDGAAAPVGGARLIHPAAGFVREIIPYDDGPPSSIHRHVLIGVFRI